MLYPYRLPLILGALLFINMIGSFTLFVLPLEHRNGFSRISAIEGEAISSSGAFVLLNDEGEVVEERGVTVRSLPPMIWGLLLIAATALLLLNWFFPGAERLTTPEVTSRFEVLITLLFLLLWWYWDEGRQALWFPLTLFHSALLSFSLFLSLRQIRLFAK